MNRRCTICQIKEPRNNTASYCKSCHNEYQKKYYKTHPQSIDQAAKKRRASIRQLIIDKKNVPCMDCKVSYPSYVMDFDHVRGNKQFNLSTAAEKSKQRVTEEMAKCDIICANCHRIRTWKH